ncbi:type I phosphomannose isomerase catalytic subunit [Patiriisocius sp. Uisw_047]|jgi:mannose-6-phosphate isomerase|uniref:type I phosphomannose isomerase catalytic subunit n=1 Tax=Patiriisocius sp. Uisw_047 TaxID=3230969 RepID=UPI0039EC0AEB
MVDISLYPLKFTPILKEKIWGGSKLKELFNKKGKGKIGESWELSGVKGEISIVSHGKLKNKSLDELITTYGSELLGEKVAKQYGAQFPLLFKYIDAAEDLSVQLHPDDALAKERHDSFGKTEMWYIMQAEADARLLLGFNDGVDQKSYARHISENNIVGIIKAEAVTEGDSFFLAPGTVHAIGAGIVLAEIQQTSDITYRIYDWDRPGLDGNMRDLHTEDALAAIKFDAPDARLRYIRNEKGVTSICESPYFRTSKINCISQIDLDYSKVDSFIVYMCVGGDATIKTSNTATQIKKGETLLIPACFDQISILTENAEILEVYIP